MSHIIWKGFTLDSLFEFDSSGQLSLNKKGLDFVDETDSDHTVALITQSEKNNGISGYLKDAGEVSNKKKHHAITYSMHFGLCYYHSYDFVLMDTHGSVFVLNAKNNVFKTILDCNEIVDHFLSEIITYECTNEVYSYSYLPNSSRSGREIILLPCLEVCSGEDFIWEDNGKHYTLAVDYIEKLMDSAKEEKEKKTIKLYKAEREKYEAEREKYEAEREKYEEGYIEEKPNVVWKDFKLSDIFIYKTGRDSSIAQKNLSMSKTMDLDYNVAIVTETTENNGIGFYMRDDDPILLGKIVNQGLTFGTQFGNCNFHSRPFFIIGNTNYLIEKSIKLYNIFADNSYIGLFFSSILTYIFRKSNLFGFGNKIDHDAFYREIILLPCLEVSSDEDFIWEGNGKYYNLAVNYIAYIYLTGKINYNNKLIDSYSYLY